MNERIRELADQAGLPTYNPGDGIPTKLEKFAELIVRECASQVVINEALNIFEHFDLESPVWSKE